MDSGILALIVDGGVRDLCTSRARDTIKLSAVTRLGPSREQLLSGSQNGQGLLAI